MPSSGLVLGRYRPLRPLGSGGSGSVWLCHDEQAGIEVALKIIAREGRAEPRAEREAEAATRLRHPNCLRAYGLEADDRHLYIPYEYVPGITLRQALRSGQLGDDGAIESAAQVLDGLAFAHARGIVHRDVKPSNVLVAEQDEISVRLFDFGLAQLADADTLTAVGDVPGTLAYISPERLHGEQAGPPADVWAVGVLLWEALAGHHPFWRESPLETGEEIKTGAPSIREARPDLPDRVVAAVDAALEVDPAGRPSAGGLAQELRDAWWERSPKRARSRPKLRFAPRRAVTKLVAPSLAALSTAWVASALPFYPELWPLVLAALAAGLALLKPRLGLAFTLAVPVLPLGNVAFGLAVAYALVAAVWLVLMWGDARRGLLFATGLVLGPLGLLGLAPIAVLGARGIVRRVAHAAAAVLLAGAAAGARGAEIPFTGRPAEELDVTGSEHPIAVLQAVWQWLEATPALGLEALILGLAAGSLLLVARGTDLTIASFAGCLLAGTLLVAPDTAAVPLVATGWITYVALTLMSRRLPERAGKRRSFGALVTQTRAQFADRLKAGGGMRRPRSSTRFRHAGAR
ncbi:MAG TPA: serine/threonine-protein kinase [Gaiellaceae bacterium]|nr:serine/threonine-protein kinase [Gaiellaceae bacterium]